MNIHEHQAKDLLKKFEAPVPIGIIIYNIKEISQKIKSIKFKNSVIKAQIYAGGRGKAGGIKLVKSKKDLLSEATKMFGKTLISKQTGPQGKKVQRIYIEEASAIKQEFYLACLIDRSSSKIAFCSCFWSAKFRKFSELISSSDFNGIDKTFFFILVLVWHK